MIQNDNNQAIVQQLQGIACQIKRIKNLLVSLKTTHSDPLSRDIQALLKQLEKCSNPDILNLCIEFFETDTINFLANIDDLVNEVEQSEKGTANYLETLNRLV
ncbi:hypothetical protein [Leuconostoc citreum]|uniref:hypothetical protein n=1 Tax=Leuconostoc citreum TaxID=33964 RepID=UPI0032DEDAFA